MWPVLPDLSDLDEINTINTIDDNSLDASRHGKHFDLKEGKSRPLDSWDREGSQDVVGNEDDTDFNGPLYSDQEQVNIFIHYQTYRNKIYRRYRLINILIICFDSLLDLIARGDRLID